jgi:hypothetical protein
MSKAIKKVKISLNRGETFPQLLAIQFLFTNLRELWDIFLISYINSKYDLVVAMVGLISQVLIQEEIRVKISSTLESLIKAQKGKKQKKDKKSGNRKLLKALNLKCNHCGKTGYNKTNCWELNPDKYLKR